MAEIYGIKLKNIKRYQDTVKAKIWLDGVPVGNIIKQNGYYYLDIQENSKKYGNEIDIFLNKAYSKEIEQAQKKDLENREKINALIEEYCETEEICNWVYQNHVSVFFDDLLNLAEIERYYHKYGSVGIVKCDSSFILVVNVKPAEDKKIKVIKVFEPKDFIIPLGVKKVDLEKEIGINAASCK